VRRLEWTLIAGLLLALAFQFGSPANAEEPISAECTVVPFAKTAKDHAEKYSKAMQDHIAAGRTHGMYVLPWGQGVGELGAPGSLCAW